MSEVKFWIGLLAFTFILDPLLAAEAGPFECRITLTKKYRSDAKDDLNEMVNTKLDSLESEVSGLKCDKSSQIFNIFQDSSGGSINTVMGTVEEEMETIIAIDRKKQWKDMKGYWCKTTGFGHIFHQSRLSMPTGIKASIRLCGQQVSLDKLGHFFNQGLELHSKYTGKFVGSWYKKIWLSIKTRNTTPKKKKPEKNRFKEALLYSYGSEFLYYGADVTGVVSYADMAANSSGFTFWKQLFSNAETNDTYFGCRNGKIYRTSKRFNWCDYTHPLWDEAINCSEVVLRDKDDKIIGYEPMAEFAGRKCPVNEEQCLEGIEHLKKEIGTDRFLSDLAGLVVSPSCVKVYNERNSAKIQTCNHPESSCPKLAPPSPSSINEATQ